MAAPAEGLAIVIKTEQDPLTAVTPLREIVRSIDPNLPLADVRTLDDITARALAAPRFAAWLLGLFAALALTLAAIGTYATISLLVSERAQEIGIRIALGAERSTILRWVLGEGLVLAAVGIAIGVIGALLLSRALETLLYGVQRTGSRHVYDGADRLGDRCAACLLDSCTSRGFDGSRDGIASRMRFRQRSPDALGDIGRCCDPAGPRTITNSWFPSLEGFSRLQQRRLPRRLSA